MDTGNASSGRVIHFISRHFYSLYLFSFLLVIAIGFHSVISILPHPVVAQGEIVDKKEENTYKYSYGRGIGVIVFRKFVYLIKFDWRGNSYIVAGNPNKSYGRGIGPKVIFDAHHPETARDFSLLSFFDFDVTAYSLTIWLVFSAFLYGLAMSDDHFIIFNFRMRKLSLKAFLILLILTLALPFYQYTDLLIFGRITEGVMTNQSDFVGGHFNHALVYKVNENSYVTHAPDMDWDMQTEGTPYKVLYLAPYPGRSAVYDFDSMYFSNYYGVMIVLLLFLSGWFYASRGDSNSDT